MKLCFPCNVKLLCLSGAVNIHQLINYSQLSQPAEARPMFVHSTWKDLHERGCRKDCRRGTSCAAILRHIATIRILKRPEATVREGQVAKAAGRLGSKEQTVGTVEQGLKYLRLKDRII